MTDYNNNIVGIGGDFQNESDYLYKVLDDLQLSFKDKDIFAIATDNPKNKKLENIKKINILNLNDPKQIVEFLIYKFNLKKTKILGLQAKCIDHLTKLEDCTDQQLLSLSEGIDFILGNDFIGEPAYRGKNTFDFIQNSY